MEANNQTSRVRGISSYIPPSNGKGSAGDQKSPESVKIANNPLLGTPPCTSSREHSLLDFLVEKVLVYNGVLFKSSGVPYPTSNGKTPEKENFATSDEDSPNPIAYRHLHTPLTSLIKAKEESDVKHYKAKHNIIRKLIAADPKSFMVDSDASGVVGIIHIPTGFRLHLPKTALPTALV